MLHPQYLTVPRDAALISVQYVDVSHYHNSVIIASDVTTHIRRWLATKSKSRNPDAADPSDARLV